MTVATITCDKCETEITAGRTKFDVVTGPLRPTRPTVDLCPSCAAALLSWLTVKE